MVLIGPRDELQSIGMLLTNSPDLELWQFTGRDPEPEEVSLFAEKLEEAVEREKLKRLTLLGVSWGGPIAVQYTSVFPRNVRRLILVNAMARLKQTKLEKFIEWLERFLPLGLPLRPLSKAFDPRPLLHRVRCPTLVFTTTPNAPEAEFLAVRIPNAWLYNSTFEKLPEIINQFLEVATKQPQKRVAQR